MFVDGACGGNKLAGALQQAHGPITVEVVKKAKDGKGFTVIPRRWVERSFCWLRRCRRLSKDFERFIASAFAWLRLALIRVLMRRTARCQVTVTG